MITVTPSVLEKWIKIWGAGGMKVLGSMWLVNMWQWMFVCEPPRTFAIGRRKCWVSVTLTEAEAPSCNGSGLVGSLAYCLNPALARRLVFVGDTENSWLIDALKKNACGQS